MRVPKARQPTAELPKIAHYRGESDQVNCDLFFACVFVFKSFEGSIEKCNPGKIHMTPLTNALREFRLGGEETK